jgi:hypothetical protein
LVYFAKRGFGQVLFEDGLMAHGGLNVSEPEIRPFRLSCLRWLSVRFFIGLLALSPCAGKPINILEAPDG